MRRSFKDSDRTYGARRVWRDVLEDGLPCGLHRIERLMKANGLRARPRRRGLPKDDGARSVIAENLLDRDFRAERPNQKWLADFTYVWTAEGWLYVAAVLDLFSRRIVGWRRVTLMLSARVRLSVCGYTAPVSVIMYPFGFNIFPPPGAPKIQFHMASSQR
ncbi:hypothetical protein RISW2_21610 [Roseivivax isoporae LMG 25204]|uniref:Integrase catalytic domain-containing protein n=1 Tax=Roseivivax isoporae LMG 25204 TaxID=1449351 RepID=X7F1L7_9RHOB|nr:hypothetical protein RISW2_21610 [Roseivivax isoporae LMG 25204]